MKKSNSLIVFLCSFLLLSSFTIKAQIMADADLSEWGGTDKMHYDKENDLFYAFKKDNQFLYLALLKNKNASKFNGGGVQVFFSNKAGDTTGLQVVFASKMKDPDTNQFLKYTHDFFSVRNLNRIPSQQLPTYNETGIMVVWNVTDIEYFVVRNSVLDEKATPANPNIFTAEVQIPLEYLKKYCINNTLHFGIALRGLSYNFKMQSMPMADNGTKSIYQKEFWDRMTPTSFFGSIDLNTL